MTTVQAEHIGYICIQVHSQHCFAALLMEILGTFRYLFEESVGRKRWKSKLLQNVPRYRPLDS